MADAMQGMMALQGAPMMDQGPRAMGGGIDPSLVDPAITQYARTDPQQFSGDILGGMEQADPRLVYELRSVLAQYQLPPQVIDALATMVDMLLSDPANYEANRMEFIREGVPEEILPPTFDAAYLAGLEVALNEMSKMQAPQRFAQGGIAELKPIARAMSEMGRGGDTMLAHINPAEARMLRVMGGSGTINPYTGLPEFIFKAAAKAVKGVVGGAAKAVGAVVKGAANVVKAVAKPIVNVVKKIASSPIGKIALTAAAVYFMGPTQLNAAGSLFKVSGSTALGVNTFLGSTAVNLASGQSIGQAVKGGAIAGLTAGVVSNITGALPPGYETAPGGVPTGIPPVEGGIPAPAVGDYASSGDFAALEAGAAREAAAAAGAATPSPVDLGIGSLTESPLATTAPGVAAPAVTAPATTIPQAGVSGAGLSSAEMAALRGAPAYGEPTSFMDTARSAYNTVADPIKGAYESVADMISPSRIREAGRADQFDAYKDMILKTGGKVAEDGTLVGGNVALATEAFKAAAPGMLATYGPLALAGTGALMAAGAFTPVQPKPPGIVPDSIYSNEPGEDIGIGGVNIVNAPGAGAGSGYGTGAEIGLGDTSFYRTGSQYDPSMQFQVPQFTVRKPEDYLTAMNMFPQRQYAQGGIASLDGYKKGGKVRTYPRKTGAINGPGTETSDSIPALLSDGEFVFTAKAVRGAGGGSRRAGAKRMYALMKALENKANG